jgi:anaerobic selenocysteine-containing dehydrogenase
MLNDRSSQLFEELATHFLRSLDSSSYSSSQASTELGYRFTQGVQRMPGFDLAQSDLVISFGLDLYEDGPSPMHAVTSMIGSRADGERGRLIHVGTRLSPSGAKADHHLSILPGTAAAAALGIAHILLREGNVDRQFLRDHCFGFEDWIDADQIGHEGFDHALLEDYYPERAARICGCSAVALVRLARQIARAERPLALAGGEALAHQNATFTVMAVHALNALLGAFDRPGGVVMPGKLPLSPLTPISGTRPASCFDAAGEELGVDPLRALAEAAGEGSGGVEALFLVDTDPLHQSPHADLLRSALGRIPLVVALTSFPNETSELADFVLPTHVPFESWQDCTTPGGVPFSYVGLGQPVLDPIHDTRHPADILLELSNGIGGSVARTVPWRRYDEYLKDRLRGLLSSGEGAVISGSFEEDWAQFLERRGWRFLEHTDFAKLWEDLVEASGWWNPVIHRGDWARLMPTESGKFEFYSNSLANQFEAVGRSAGQGSNRESRIRAGAEKLGVQAPGDKVCLPHFEPARENGEGELWLVPFRPLTARGPYATKSAMLLAMFGFSVLSSWKTWVELAPETAHDLNIGDGDTVALESEHGSAEAVVCLNAGAVPGVANISLGLGHEGPDGIDHGVGSNPARVIVPEHDPFTGAATLASTRARLRLIRRRPRGGPAPAGGGHI